MAKSDPKSPGDFIAPLNMNGLKGRMLHMPSQTGRKRHILLIYGHHASLERMVGVAEALSNYGDVAIPDLPGFGGMESFYKIGEKPTLDNLADYLAAFVKLRYNRRRVTVMGMSFGFLVATRMLQRHPELAKKVDLLVSLVGFVHHEDFRIKKSNYRLLRTGATIMSMRLPAFIIKHLVFRGPLIRTAYSMTSNVKFKDTKPEDWRTQVDFETKLWKLNDVRTRGSTAVTAFTVDLCANRIKLPVTHVCISRDRYFDNRLVEQHLNVIFEKVKIIEMDLHGHAPTVVANADEALQFIPPQLRRVLARQ